MNAEIAALEKRVRELINELNETRLILTQKKMDICGIKIGDIVTDARGTEFRVTNIDVSMWKPSDDEIFKINNPWVSGNPRKKDGEFGNSVRNLYGNWRKHERQEMQDAAQAGAGADGRQT